MNKELEEMTLKEALKMLNECGTNINSLYEQTVLDLINKSLTTPTEEYVCNVLNEYYENETVRYDKSLKAFIFNNPDHIIACVNSYNDNLYHINHPLPPRLIKLLGEFYEGETNE